MIRSRLAPSVVLLAAAGVALVTVASAQGPSSSLSAQAKSRALTAAPVVTAPGPAYRADQARTVADTLASLIPLPAGGNANGIRWEQIDGTVGDLEIQHVLQYNAACQWWRALRDGRDADVAPAIVADVPRWSALRDTEAGAVAAQVADELAAGGGPVATAVLADCDASHEREVDYGAIQGRVPST